MRQYLIDKTQRESLVYSLLIELKYNTAKLANTKNRLFRNRKISNYLLSHPVRKIHFGAGSGKYGEASTTQLSGFLNTDILGETPIDISKPLPFADQSIDIIFSSHLIEHIYHRHFKRFLAESFRILKSGGQQIIATPSLEKLCRALYGENDSIKRTIYETHLGKIMGKSLTPAMVINGMSHINYGHKYLYDFETISILATDIGYKAVSRVESAAISDEEIRRFLIQKGAHYEAETEIFLLTK